MGWSAALGAAQCWASVGFGYNQIEPTYRSRKQPFIPLTYQEYSFLISQVKAEGFHMSFWSRWIKGLPSEQAEVPEIEGVTIEVSIHDFDDASEVDGQECRDEHNPVTDIYTAIEYCAANGELTRRRITMRRIDFNYSVPSLYAFCHERRAIRQFRTDRIKCFITADGEIIEPNMFWRSIGVDFDEIEYTPQERSGETSETNRTKRMLRDQIRILAALSRADGKMRDEEVNAIIEYIEIEVEWDRIDLSEETITELSAYIKRLRPTAEKVSESLFRLFEEPEGRKRLYAKELERFMRAAKNVIDADGVLHETEVEFYNGMAEIASQ
ncbi:TerB family tellurite resistance protein [Roseovarius bejariae]|uniref:WYL domain-containing protein n=1 Tax=Roseovarius bejariae TaxID=2576383 RepID=UPI001561DCE8|nr:TerB family tellurite resistance protein [Roseovarius bejariae]